MSVPHTSLSLCCSFEMPYQWSMTIRLISNTPTSPSYTVTSPFLHGWVGPDAILRPGVSVCVCVRVHKEEHCSVIRGTALTPKCSICRGLGPTVRRKRDIICPAVSCVPSPTAFVCAYQCQPPSLSPSLSHPALLRHLLYVCMCVCVCVCV